MIALELAPEVLAVEDREAMFLNLYKNTFPTVARFVRSQNGSLADAKDVFHDALIIFYEKLVGDKMEVEVSHEAYLVGIAKHVWLRKFNTEISKLSMTEIESLITITDGDDKEVDTHRLLEFLEQAGKRCMEMLTDFYYHHLSMKKVMDKFGFSSERSATVQKFKCLEKVRDVVKSKSARYEDFLE